MVLSCSSSDSALIHLRSIDPASSQPRLVSCSSLYDKGSYSRRSYPNLQPPPTSNSENTTQPHNHQKQKQHHSHGLCALPVLPPRAHPLANVLPARLSRHLAPALLPLGNCLCRAQPASSAASAAAASLERRPRRRGQQTRRIEQ